MCLCRAVESSADVPGSILAAVLGHELTEIPIKILGIWKFRQNYARLVLRVLMAEYVMGVDKRRVAGTNSNTFGIPSAILAVYK